jgi:hypothetical protein
MDFDLKLIQGQTISNAEIQLKFKVGALLNHVDL